tara:strand:+ start:75 stop:458 length:384 start_codon:yes stop_codon:yes gene_type:complete
MSSGNEDKSAITETITMYLDGIRKHDTKLISAAFHPQAILSSHYEEEFSIVPAARSIVDYMNTTPPATESSPDFSGEILSIEQKGTMATAVIAENALEGLNFTTYFHLHKVDGNWLISSKATYGEPV